VAAAEAEAERVAQTHIVMANHSAGSEPLSSPEPVMDEFVDEQPSDDHQPEAVSDESEALAPPIKKRVVRRK